MRQVADEADGVREQDLAARRKLQLPELGIKGSEHAAGLKHASLGEGVEERALASVGIADERDDRDGNGLATLPLLMADAANGVELGLDVIEAKIDLAAIGFELSFPRAAGSDAAAELRHRAAASSEAGELVFELRELYLELAFAGTGVAGEDIEDELRPVNDVAGQTSLDVAELRRAEVVIEEDERGVGAGNGADDLFEFALADEAGGIRPLAALDEGGGDGGAGGAGELLELGAAGLEVEGGGGGDGQIIFSGEDGGRGASKAGGASELLALAEFAGELGYDEDGELLLGL